jgi:hypothetical protein
MPEVSLDDVTKGLGAAAAFALAFGPGFVAMKSYDLFQPEWRKVQDMVYEIVGYSAVSYVIVSPLLWYVVLHWEAVKLNWQFFCGASLAVVLVVPSALGCGVALFQKWLRRDLLSRLMTPWDYAFKNRIWTYIVEAELADGSKIAGLASSVSAYPNQHELFIGQQWAVEGDKVLGPLPDVRGVLLFNDDIKRVRFLERPPT